MFWEELAMNGNSRNVLERIPFTLRESMLAEFMLNTWDATFQRRVSTCPSCVGRERIVMFVHLVTAFWSDRRHHLFPDIVIRIYGPIHFLVSSRLF